MFYSILCVNEVLSLQHFKQFHGYWFAEYRSRPRSRRSDAVLIACLSSKRGQAFSYPLLFFFNDVIAVNYREKLNRSAFVRKKNVLW